jgi:hypothetical protein
LVASTTYNERVKRSRADLTPSITRAVDWSTAGACRHAVQFYASDGHLLDLLTRFVGMTLVSGDVALVVATKPHRDGLAKRLKTNGLDIDVPREQGRFVALDAETTVGKVSEAGAVDAALFQQFFGGIMDVLQAGNRRRIVAFCEMVALLCAQSRAESAIQVERFWNDLALRHHFSLCCGYPMNGFGNRHAAVFMKICAQHSHVFTVPDATRSPAAAADR